MVPCRSIIRFYLVNPHVRNWTIISLVFFFFLLLHRFEGNAWRLRLDEYRLSNVYVTKNRVRGDSCAARYG